LFPDRPALSAYGLVPLRVVDGHELWNVGEAARVPDMSHARAAADGGPNPSGLLVIDIEEWPLQGDPKTVSASVGTYLEFLSRMRAADPGLKYGFYSGVPLHDYWNAIAGPSSPRYQAWQRANDALQPIADGADALFPSLYTFYPDPKGWRTYAEANLAEARRMAKEKPVYCFLAFQYHEGTANALQMIPADYWRMELDTCRQFADGIVIWGGYTLPGGAFHALKWDDNAPWWRATLDFLHANRSN
jgi:hypothetical protein